MPSVHKNPAKAFRPDPELYERAKVAVAKVDSDMNGHLVAFLRWLTHEGDLPARPPAPATPPPAADDR